MTTIAITKPQQCHNDIIIDMILDQFEKMGSDSADLERERFKLYCDSDYRNSWHEYLAR